LPAIAALATEVLLLLLLSTFTSLKKFALLFLLSLNSHKLGYKVQ